MNIIKYFYPITISFILFPLGVLGQPELGGSRMETKTVQQARGLAVTNTLMPVAVGVGSVALFENNTVQTIGAAMAVYGLVVGPSTGNMYANDYTRGAMGVLARAAGGYLMADATSEIFGRSFADALNVDNEDVTLTDTKILIGEALIIGSIIYNILSVRNSVEEYNAAHGQRIRISVEPSEGPFSNNFTPVLSGKFYF